MSHTKEDLKALRAKTLDEKIQISTARIIEWYEYWKGKVYVSNSGGVDSTVLSDLVHRVYPDVVDVYCDTGLEYPELRDFIMSNPNVIVLKPQVYNRKTRKYENISFPEIIKQCGYPLISKEVSRDVRVIKNNPGCKTKEKFDPNSEYCKKYKGFDKSKYMFLSYADFDVGAYCCNIMKKNPAKRFETETGLHPYIGTMAEESRNRAVNWMKFGCNAFNKDRPTSNPCLFGLSRIFLSISTTIKFHIALCMVIL